MAHQTESQLQREVRLALGQLDDLVLWRNETGAYAEACTVGWLKELVGVLTNKGTKTAHMMLADAIQGARQYVRYGLCKGSADLIGILKPSGRFFALELKTEVGRISDDQRLFLKLINNMGGYAAVARTVDEAKKHYWRALEGLEAQ